MAYRKLDGVHNFWVYKEFWLTLCVQISCTAIKFQEKCPYFCLWSILSETHRSADTYFFQGMSLLPAKRRQMKFIVKS